MRFRRTNVVAQCTIHRGERALPVSANVRLATYVPKPMTSNAKAEERFDKSAFIYIAKADEHQCPAGERAIYRFTTFEKNGNKLRVYWTSACCVLTASSR